MPKYKILEYVQDYVGEYYVKDVKKFTAPDFEHAVQKAKSNYTPGAMVGVVLNRENNFYKYTVSSFATKGKKFEIRLDE